MASSPRTLARSSQRNRNITLSIIGVVVAVAAIVFWIVFATSRGALGNTAPASEIPADTSMGVIELNVSDLETMQEYYEHALGLEVLDSSDTEVTLGLDTPLFTLIEHDGGAAAASPTEAGLYHSAVLYPDEQSLAAVLLHLATEAPASFQGSADHAVSLAFYFVDPEGNGLELYVDRPEDSWEWVNGEVTMGSAVLDPNAFIQQYVGDASMPDAAVMGHVHMKVGDLTEAESFYEDLLGFAVTARSEGALFYGAGGYHHHLATNVWQTAGATSRSNPTGLGALTVRVTEASAIDALADRLDAAGADYERSDATLETEDPWGNRVNVVLQ